MVLLSDNSQRDHIYIPSRPLFLWEFFSLLVHIRRVSYLSRWFAYSAHTHIMQHSYLNYSYSISLLMPRLLLHLSHSMGVILLWSWCSRDFPPCILVLLRSSVRISHLSRVLLPTVVHLLPYRYPRWVQGVREIYVYYYVRRVFALSGSSKALHSSDTWGMWKPRVHWKMRILCS